MLDCEGAEVQGCTNGKCDTTCVGTGALCMGADDCPSVDCLGDGSAQACLNGSCQTEYELCCLP